MSWELDTSAWMTKKLIFPPINEQGDQVVDWITTENSGLVKTAAAGKTTYHKRIQDYIERVKPRKDMACCVISALGSYETWGQNVNGDRFPRIMFVEGQHKTYERNGFPYKHHLNKPHLGHKQYGERVTLAEFNDKMDRVELIVWYDLSRDTNLLDDIESGNVGVSMGMKTPYDECTIKGCGNKAKTPRDYCAHAHPEKGLSYGYRMGMILPDGQQIGRWNRYANFFDISRVLIPAWKPGRILEKVASQNQRFWNINPEFMRPSAELAKEAQIKKAEMYKTVPGLDEQKNKKAVEFLNMAQDIQSCEPEIPRGTIHRIAEKAPLKNIISTMLGLGVVPKPKEFQRIVLVKTGQAKLADHFEKIGCVFTDYPEGGCSNPDLIDIAPEFFSEKIACELEPYLKDRSCLRPFLFDRMEKMASQNLLLPKQNLIGRKTEKRNLGSEALKTMAGIGGLFALMRGGITGAPLKYKEKTMMPLLKDIPNAKPGFKIEKTFEKMFGTNPLIKMMVLAAVGKGAITAWQKMNTDKPLTNYDQPLDTPPLVRYNDNYLDDLARRNETPFVKLGGWNPSKIVSMFKGPEARTFGKTFTRAAIGLPAAYMLAGVLQNKMNRDPYAQASEGSIGGFLRKHPGIAATAFTFHPHAIDIAKGLIKKASVASDVKDWAIFGAMEQGNPMTNISGGVVDALLINAVSKAYKAVKNRVNKNRFNQPKFSNHYHRR